MKNYDLGLRIEELEFDGSKITVEMMPLDLPTFSRIVPKLEEINEMKRKSSEDNEVNSNMNILSYVAGLQDDFLPIARKHIKNIKGFKVNGQDPEVENLFGNIGFCLLLIEIFTKLIGISTLTEVEEKN